MRVRNRAAGSCWSSSVNAGSEWPAGPSSRQRIPGALFECFIAVEHLGRHAVSGRYLQAPPEILGGAFSDELYFSSPLHFLSGLEGPQLKQLRRRYAVIASGEGAWENLAASWQVAEALGAKGVPNRVDSWGPDWEHDWPTWRRMLPAYLDELT